MQSFMRNFLKHFILISALAFISSCNKKPKKEEEQGSPIRIKAEEVQIDSSLIFSYKVDFHHKNIRNKSDRKIDLLFNGIENYLGGVRNPSIHFRTEWMSGQPVQSYGGGLLFAKQLLITPDHIEYFNTKIVIPDSTNRLQLIFDDGERATTQFNFQGGKGSITYIGVSCNDADYNEVRLTFDKGQIIVDSLINATFFEYDLDSNGEKEQYLLGYRNCNQEIIILRSRK